MATSIAGGKLLSEIYCMLITISLEEFCYGSIDINPEMVQIMAWCRIGDKPLSKPKMDSFRDAYMRLSASMS